MERFSGWKNLLFCLKNRFIVETVIFSKFLTNFRNLGKKLYQNL
jgi:hypothetical protein